MRLALALLFALPGAALFLAGSRFAGLLLLIVAWWIYERAGLRDTDEALTELVILLGAAGALLVILEYAWQRLS